MADRVPEEFVQAAIDSLTDEKIDPMFFAADVWHEVARRLHDEVGDWREDMRRVMEETCDDDGRQHCTCVPFQRRRIATLEEVIRHVINDSPGTPESVKEYLRRAVES